MLRLEENFEVASCYLQIHLNVLASGFFRHACLHERKMGRIRALREPSLVHTLDTISSCEKFLYSHAITITAFKASYQADQRGILLLFC